MWKYRETSGIISGMDLPRFPFAALRLCAFAFSILRIQVAVRKHPPLLKRTKADFCGLSAFF